MKIPILVYGIGNYFIKHEKEIEEKYEVVGYVDKRGGYYQENTIYTSILDFTREEL